jgi:hypothetical protein
LEINIENLIEIIVKEVITELARIGVKVNSSESIKDLNNLKIEKQEIDMSNYKTPILTENMLESIEENVREIIVPKGTVMTPGARELLKKKNFKVSNN